MTTETQSVRCACEDCVCEVPAAQAVTREARHYCSEACADHHPDGAGCGHAGCGCHG